MLAPLVSTMAGHPLDYVCVLTSSHHLRFAHARGAFSSEKNWHSSSSRLAVGADMVWGQCKGARLYVKFSACCDAERLRGRDLRSCMPRSCSLAIDVSS